MMWAMGPWPVCKALCVTLVISACLVRSSSQSRLWTARQHGPAEGQEDVSVGSFLHPVYPGIEPQYESMSFSSYIFRRDCLANGSNYCFGNTVDFCPNCGTCCSGSTGHFCCSDASSTCCGNGCCQAGDVCTNGQCATPVVTTTTTTTVVATVTHVATELASIELRVDETSTVISTVVVTASDVETATEITYTTTTAVAKRGLPSFVPGESLDRKHNFAPDSSTPHFVSLLTRLLKRASGHDGSGPISPFEPRFDPAPWTYQHEDQPEIKVARAVSTVTSVVTATRTTDVTRTVSNTVTALTTLVDIVTSIQTKISAPNAKATVSTTSTVVVRPKPPVTETSTTIMTLLAGDASPSSTSSQTSGYIPGSTISANPGSSLPTPTIIGIGVGSGIAAILLIGALVIWRVRCRRQSPPSYDPWYPPGPGPDPLKVPMASAPREQPTTVPTDFSHYTRLPRTSKRSSGQSALLKPGSAQGYQARDRSSTGTHSYSGSSTLRASTPVEVAGSNPPERHEIEGGRPSLHSGRGRSVSQTSFGQRFMYRS